MDQDLRETAGVDFLSALFSFGVASNDSILLLHVLDFQTALTPGLLELAVHRATPAELRALEETYEQLLDRLDDIEAAAELAVEAQDLIALISMNGIIRAVHDATRPTRLRLMQLVLETADARAFFETHLDTLRDYADGETPHDEITARYREILERSTASAQTWLAARAAVVPHAPMYNGADA